MLILLAAFITTADAPAQSLRPTPQVGDTYEITKIGETSQQSGDQSSGSSYDKDTLSERVIAVRADGVELEYDLPRGATKEDRDRSWQFPARVFKPRSGPVQLLNGSELEVRLDRWLKAAKWTRAACGHWIFTWNAFRIECDPQSVIRAVESFDLRPADLREGAKYQQAGARGAGILTRKAATSGETFTAELEIDPEAVRRAEAESDVAVGEIMQKPVTLDAALNQRAKESVSGTISVTFETDPGGNVRRRTTVTKLEVKGTDGRTEIRTNTETLERQLVSKSKS